MRSPSAHAVLLLLLVSMALAQASPGATISAQSTPAGIVVTWSRPPDTWACLKFVGMSPDQFIGQCAVSGSLLLDRGLAQYAGRGRRVGLWGASGTWVAGPIDLPLGLATPTPLPTPEPTRWRVIMPYVVRE